MTAAEKPWACPEHPEAQIRHEWDRTRTDVRLTGASWETDANHRYFCAACGIELATSETPEYASERNKPRRMPL